MSHDKERPPISRAGLDACRAWLSQCGAGQVADHSLLTQGLEQGRIVRAEAIDHNGRPAAAVTIRQQEKRKERTPRIFDPAAFCVIRLLLLPKAIIRVDANDLPRTLHYVELYDHISAFRLIAGAGAGQVPRQLVRSPYDYMRGNLTIVSARKVRDEGKKVKRIRKDRNYAIERALTYFAKEQAKGNLDHLPINAEEYETILAEAFAILDLIPLGSGLTLATAG